MIVCSSPAHSPPCVTWQVTQVLLTGTVLVMFLVLNLACTFGASQCSSGSALVINLNTGVDLLLFICSRSSRI